MRYLCFVTDYDGTLATDGRVTPETVSALDRLHRSGRKLIMATGRLLPELLEIFPEAKMFDRIVAENGALLYRPSTNESVVLTEPPPKAFVDELLERGVPGVQVGDSIVATWRPHENTVLDVIRDMGLSLQVIFNKDAVMILPSGVNKASGLKVALDELSLSAHNAVGIGDAENDHPFLSLCECSAVVSNALPSLFERADFVASKPRGAGVEELIGMLLEDDLASIESRLARHRLVLGQDESGAEYTIKPYNSRLLIAGPSGGGKSTTLAALVERLLQKQYQICLIDPEGDYDDVEHFVTLGGPDRVPANTEILEVLKKPENSLSLNLLGISLPDRPSFLVGILPQLQELRTRTGRPHWLMIDEAHHLLPDEAKPLELAIPNDPSNLLLITVHPEHVARSLLETINGLLIIGPDPQAVIAEFQKVSGIALPDFTLTGGENRSGKIVAWMFGQGESPKQVTVNPAKLELKRHRRKYAAGDLGEDKSFYFRGPENKLSLRANNLNTFVQLAQGIDEDTWLFHLKNHQYSQWLRDVIKDESVADELQKIEDDSSLSPADSRSRIIKAIETQYTAPA